MNPERAFGWSVVRELLGSSDALERSLERARERLAAHGDARRWFETVEELARVAGGAPSARRGGGEGDGDATPAYDLELDAPAPRVGARSASSARIEELLRALGPWKKGPFDVHGVTVDAEWRSCLKWDRVTREASSFRDRAVLDVGSGNGYFLLRLLGAGARAAVGVDPSVLVSAQYAALEACFRPPRLGFVPLPFEELAPAAPRFDTVLSLGVLYHRRNPLEHLSELGRWLRPGGELVLETLVVDGPRGHVLVPPDRYAQMRNVWSIPSLLTIESWLEERGYRTLRSGPVCLTTSEEQRSTSWMTHPSLADFLDAGDSSRTVEGHPAPRRVVIVAKRAD